MSELYWHEVAGGVWHAGGLTRLFEITLDDDGRFSLDVTEGERFPEYVGDYATLDQAQRAALRVFGLRGGEAVDPLGDALAREHPERLAAP